MILTNFKRVEKISGRMGGRKPPNVLAQYTAFPYLLKLTFEKKYFPLTSIIKKIHVQELVQFLKSADTSVI